MIYIDLTLARIMVMGLVQRNNFGQSHKKVPNILKKAMESES